ncbi:hypothetical protein Q6350_02820 [Isoptericola sp. b515]|uniref:hypothetical protein n=1 Tax=Isoptericola sp. b515 TaxID=3064652 RepID=UPI002712B597|nr:hypothetical protein [Isoptericola sp. b515]MDO8147355.1 hypothetical protein [Isoptericola sp. b515]
MSVVGRWLHGWRLVAVVVAVGALMLCAALVISLVGGDQDQGGLRPWLTAVLINLGAAVLLIVPIELLATALRRQVTASEQRTQEQVESVRRESTERIDELTSRIESLAGAENHIDEVMAEEVSADRELYQCFLNEEVNAADAWKALDRATRRGLISPAGVKVSFDADGKTYVTFKHIPQDRIQVFLIQGGQRIVSHIWAGSMTGKGLLAILYRKTRNTGRDIRPEPKMIWGGLARTLIYAEEHEEERPVTELPALGED